jgi:hypothetical protein
VSVLRWTDGQTSSRNNFGRRRVAQGQRRSTQRQQTRGRMGLTSRPPLIQKTSSIPCCKLLVDIFVFCTSTLPRHAARAACLVPQHGSRKQQTGITTRAQARRGQQPPTPAPHYFLSHSLNWRAAWAPRATARTRSGTVTAIVRSVAWSACRALGSGEDH